MDLYASVLALIYGNGPGETNGGLQEAIATIDRFLARQPEYNRSRAKGKPGEIARQVGETWVGTKGEGDPRRGDYSY